MSAAVRAITALGLAVLLLGTAGCATRFSPDMIREVVREQSGADPRGVFEVNLGRFSTALLKNAFSAAAADDAAIPPAFAGVDSLQLAVYEVPSDEGPAIDVTQIPVRGWDPVVRFHDDQRSVTVLIQGTDETVKDLVVVGAGRRQVVYGRVTGTLSADLPQTLAKVLREGGPEALRDSLNEFATATTP